MRSSADRMPTYPPTRRDLCWRGRQPGHRYRDCPARRSTSTTSTVGQPTSHPDHRKASVLTPQCRSRAKVYADIEYNGRMYRALLDTGCDSSDLGNRILPELSYHTSADKLYAANSTVAPILGTACITFEIAGTITEYEFLVSDAIDEIILGADWLEANGCLWNFDISSLQIQRLLGARTVLLVSASRLNCVRRIYAESTIELPLARSSLFLYGLLCRLLRLIW